MPRAFTPKVVTANDLVAGDVVYLAASNAWVRSLEEADVLKEEADAELRLIEASARTGEVVGVYLADVTLAAGQPRPAHFREAFRASGPSNYPHGKQETL